MSYTYLLEQVEESSAASFSDIPQSVLSKLNLTAEKSYSKDNGTESCQDSQSGTMSVPSTELHGEGKSMLSAEDFHVQTFQMPINVNQGYLDLMEKEVDCGLRCLGLFARFDLKSFLWKTCQILLNLGLDQSYLIWPKSGIMQNGVCWEAEIVEEYIKEKEFGFSLFTPTSTDYKRNNLSTPMWKRRMETRKSPGTLPEQLAWMGFENILCPTLPEKMMRWPIGWTDLKQLEMDKIHLWLQQHGEFLEENK